MFGEEWKRERCGSPQRRLSMAKRRYVSVTNWYSLMNQRASFVRVSSSCARSAHAAFLLSCQESSFGKTFWFGPIGKILTEPADVNQTSAALRMIPYACVCCRCKSVVCFFRLALTGYNKGILQEDVQPPVELYPMVVSRYGSRQRFLWHGAWFIRQFSGSS